MFWECRQLTGIPTARFSPDGKHLVAATAYGLLYFAWDFERVENGMLFADVGEHLLVDEPVRDLCWEMHQHRLAVRTVRSASLFS